MAKTKLIVNITRGDAVCVGELADRPLRRMRGLIGRRELPAGEGLLLSPAPAIHTGFMRFPIDAVFLDCDLRILRVVERLRPWRVASEHRARAVLELSAGECARRGVEVGDLLEIRDRMAAESPWSDARAAAEGDVADEDASERAVTPTVYWQRDELTRLQPMRVLVISPDRQFRTVTALLLPRRGCSVTTTANAGRVTELVAREHADVVVIDAGQLPASAARAAAMVNARPVGVVVVADEGHSEPDEPPVLAKWGPFGDLFAAIERADVARGIWGDTGERG